MPKGIDQARVDKVLEANPFFAGKSMLPDVRPGVGEIESGVRHVEIPAAHHGFVLLELLELGQQAAIPILAVGKATQIAFGVGDID